MQVLKCIKPIKYKRMKQFIPILSLAILMTACTSNPNTNTTSAATEVQQAPTITVDTVGLAQFQQWRATNELAALNEYKASALQNAIPVKRTKKYFSTPMPQVQSGNTTSANTATSPASGNTEGGAISSEASNTAKAPVKK